MKVRIYSDMHLDHQIYPNGDISHLWYPPVLPDDKDTILILAGDLWIGTKFIEYAGQSWISILAQRFKKILVVLGNHDLWPQGDLTILRGAEKCNNLLEQMGIFNVEVLDMDTYADGNYLFVGCTLWTDMNKADPLTMHNMPTFMNYDGKIAYETGPNGQWSRFTSEKLV